MSATLDRILDLDAAEELIGGLCVALTNRRVYGTEHRRTRAAVRQFCKLLGGHFRRMRSTEPLWFRIEGGQMSYQGFPLGNSSRMLRLAAALERRHCAAMSLSPKVTEDAVDQLLQWLSGLAEGALPDLPGIGLAVEAPTEGRSPSDIDSVAAQFPEFRVPLRIYKAAATSLRNSMEKTRAGRGIDLQEIADLVGCVAEEAFTSGSRLLGPIQLVKDDSFTLQHSINVFFISTALLQPFARDARQLAAFAQAALLHDIGKSLIPEAILNKRNRLTPDEEAVIRSHTVLGAEILMDQRGVDPLAIEVAYCHHMRDDGHGYPNPELPIAPGPVTQLVQVADIFEALTARRPYKEPYTVKEAIDEILRMPGMESRRPAVSLLMARLTDSPPGSQVVLTTGDEAMVVTPNATAPERPVVQLLKDANGEPYDEPRTIDLADTASPLAGAAVARVILRPGHVEFDDAEILA